MTTMIERVARAICQSQTQGTGFWKAFIPEARAAIAAMREPTEGMVEAGDIPDCDAPHKPAGAVWRTMVDEALEEKL